MSFIFDGDTGATYADLQRKRKIAESLGRQNSRTPKNVGEGIHAIARGLVQRGIGKQNAQAMKDNPQLAAMANMQGLQDVMGKNPSPEVISALMGGAPNFARGGVMPHGGPAVVGENGPEVVQLPQGAQVRPFQPGNEQDDAPEWFRALPPERQQEFLDLTPEDKQRIVPMLQDGGTSIDEIFAPGGMDQREMNNTFAPGAEYQTAETGEQKLPYGDEKLTSDQSKSVAYYRRGFGANQTLSDPKMAEALTQYTDTFAGNFGAIGRKFQDADFQVANRAASEFLAAILRKDTGAAITNEEFRLYGPMYLPQPGDKPELLDAKARARQEALTAIEMGLGTAAGLAQTTREELKPEKAPSPSEMSDEDLLKMLTGG